MGITVTHQSPTVLDARHTTTTDGAFDPVGGLRRTLVEPILGSGSAATPVTITDEDGTDITDQLEPLLFDAMTGRIDLDAERRLGQILEQSLEHFDASATLTTEELFALQAGTRAGLPAPANRVIYTPGGDIIPAAEDLLGGTGEDTFFASLAYTYHPNTLGFWFRDKAAYAQFSTWLHAQSHNAAWPAMTKKLVRDLADLPMHRLTQALILRRDEHNGNGPDSFARVIIHLLMEWVDQQRACGQAPSAGILPFTLSELFVPTSLVMVNVAAHTQATPERIGKEWALINRGLGAKLRVIPLDQLAKLDALPRAAAKAQFQPYQEPAPGEPGSRSARLKMRKQSPTQIELAADVMAMIKRMGKVNYSQNVLLTSRPTFRRSSRRSPDDPNRPGRVTLKQYLPDLHIYLDTSGSISQENYREAVITLIKLAKKLGVNLYFNSFTHVLSGESLLHTAGKTPRQIWQEFDRIPKVGGWTDFDQIWRYINASPARRRRLSLVITDFDWVPKSTRTEHPPHLFYAPCGRMDWSRITSCAQQFVRSMKHVDPTTGTKLLGMYR